MRHREAARRGPQARDAHAAPVGRPEGRCGVNDHRGSASSSTYVAVPVTSLPTAHLPADLEGRVRAHWQALSEALSEPSLTKLAEHGGEELATVLAMSDFVSETA